MLTEEPDLDKFRAIAKEIDVDPDEYVEAVKKVPIVSEEKVNNAAELLYKMAQALSQVGYEKYRITEEHKEADILFDEVHSDYEDINGNVDDLNSSIEVLSAEFDTLREKASDSAKAVAQTDSILKYIQNVATQMTLLGFNASIEAKHVGEAGAGFNVIAQEVRQLAEQTSNQTRSIEDVLGSVRSSISAIDKEITLAVGKIETNIATVKSLSSKIAQTSEKIDKISKNQN